MITTDFTDSAVQMYGAVQISHLPALSTGFAAAKDGLGRRMGG